MVSRRVEGGGGGEREGERRRMNGMGRHPVYPTPGTGSKLINE